MSKEPLEELEFHAAALVESGHYLLLGSRANGKWAKIRSAEGRVIDWTDEGLRRFAEGAAAAAAIDDIDEGLRGAVRTYYIMYAAEESSIEHTWERPEWRLANRYWSDACYWVDEYADRYGEYEAFAPIDPAPEDLGAFALQEMERHEALTRLWRTHYSALSCMFSFSDAAFFDAADALLLNEALAESMGRSPDKWQMLADALRRPLSVDKGLIRIESKARGARNRLVHLPPRLKRGLEEGSLIKSMLTAPERLREWHDAVGTITEARCSSVGYELKRWQRETFPE